jgi:hypothetical protein
VQVQVLFHFNLWHCRCVDIKRPECCRCATHERALRILNLFLAVKLPLVTWRAPATVLRCHYSVDRQTAPVIRRS